jgi:hypothetical protein
MTTNAYARQAAKKATEVKTGAPAGSRGARVVCCRNCAAPVFRGLDADLMALEVTLDVRPVNAAGELAALIEGRRTYELSWIARPGRYEIERRDHFRISGRPPGTSGIDVLTSHVCGQTIGFDRLSTGPAAHMVEHLPDEPPF